MEIVLPQDGKLVHYLHTDCTSFPLRVQFAVLVEGEKFLAYNWCQ